MSSDMPEETNNNNNPWVTLGGDNYREVTRARRRGGQVEADLHPGVVDRVRGRRLLLDVVAAVLQLGRARSLGWERVDKLRHHDQVPAQHQNGTCMCACSCQS